jgi:hypothetical protein
MYATVKARWRSPTKQERVVASIVAHLERVSSSDRSGASTTKTFLELPAERNPSKFVTMSPLIAEHAVVPVDNETGRRVLGFVRSITDLQVSVG